MQKEERADLLHPSKHGNVTKDEAGDKAKDKAHKISNDARQDTYTG